ncbi:MAG: ester cyclase [Pseudomonadota bacterium]
MAPKLTALAIAATLAGTLANAGDLDVVKRFYSDLLTTPSDVTQEQVNSVVAADWVTTPLGQAGTGAEAFFQTLQGFGVAIPDLVWEPQEILQDGNRYIVRSKATGTPAVPFLGVNPPSGKSFEIMSIDIHRVEDGRIVESFHVEDWMRAVAQLTAE